MGLNKDYVFGNEALNRIGRELSQAKGKKQEKICDFILELEKKIKAIKQ